MNDKVIEKVRLVKTENNRLLGHQGEHSYNIGPFQTEGLRHKSLWAPASTKNNLKIPQREVLEDPVRISSAANRKNFFRVIFDSTSNQRIFNRRTFPHKMIASYGCYHLIIYFIALFLLPSCSSNDFNPVNNPACPTHFIIGDQCSLEGLQCIFPDSRCGLMCTCQNQPGALRWSCPVKNCSCICPCGLIAISSCEALECKTANDQCPTSAEYICNLVCSNSKDGGLDLSLPDLRTQDATKDFTMEDSASHKDGGLDLSLPDLRTQDATKDFTMEDSASHKDGELDLSLPDLRTQDAAKDFTMEDSAGHTEASINDAQIIQDASNLKEASFSVKDGTTLDILESNDSDQCLKDSSDSDQ